MQTTHPTDDPAAVAKRIGQTIEDLKDSLAHIESAALALLGGRGAGDNWIRSTDLVVLQPLIEAVLDNHHDLIAGAGFVAEPGVLSDCTYWLEWRIVSNGAISRLEVSFEDGDFAKYDYIDASWFQQPRSGASSALAGPYVDVGGVNKYLMTLAMPVRDRELFLGIVGADILVERVEHRLRRAARDMGLAAIVLNEDARVIAASISRLHPGVLIRGVDLGVPDGHDAAPGVRAFRCGSLPWTLLVAPAQFAVQQLLGDAALSRSTAAPRQPVRQDL